MIKFAFWGVEGININQKAKNQSNMYVGCIGCYRDTYINVSIYTVLKKYKHGPKLAHDQ